jgi:hypothetical protein
MGVEEGSIEESVEGKDVSDMVGLVGRFASVWMYMVGCNIEAGWMGWLIGEFGIRWMNWYQEKMMFLAVYMTDCL